MFTFFFFFFTKYKCIVQISFSGHRTVSLTLVVRVELSPEVPVPGEPTLVTCTANVPDVRLITVYFEGRVTIDQCTFDTRNNQLQIDCTDNVLDVS